MKRQVSQANCQLIKNQDTFCVRSKKIFRLLKDFELHKAFISHKNLFLLYQSIFFLKKMLFNCQFDIQF